MTQHDYAARFQSLLAELFMLEQADLDFGIYRVMNARRKEIKNFLDGDLLPQIHEELQRNQTGDRHRTRKRAARRELFGDHSRDSPRRVEDHR